MIKSETIETIHNIKYETLYYRPAGTTTNSDHLLFIHGWGLPVKAYHNFLEKTSEKTKLPITALNLPGFGGSSSLGGKTNEENIQNQVETYIKQRSEGKKYHYIGHSFGSYILLKIFLKTKPAKNGKLILFNPLGLHEKNLNHYKNFTTSLVNELVNSDPGRIFDGGSEILKNPVNLGKTGIVALSSHIPERDLEEIPGETHLILGMNDKITPVTNIDSINKNPQINITQTPGNHGWMIKNPNESSTIVKNILDF